MEGKLCYICSPYKGDTERNETYAAALTRAAVMKGYTPIMPHLYITKVLDDRNPQERAMGMEAGLHLLESCEAIMIGGLYGISEGMQREIEAANRMGKTFMYMDTAEANVMDALFLQTVGNRKDVNGWKKDFIYLMSFINRSGVQSLLEWLETTDFYTAPASTKYHGAYEGGLVEHSLNVYHRLVKRGLVGSMDTMTITALLHDVCKADFYKKKDGGGYSVNNRFPIGHGEKSVILIMRHMQLTDEEITAINWHMGHFDDRAGGYDLIQAWKKCPLALHLHLADMEATWFDEKRGPQE